MKRKSINWWLLVSLVPISLLLMSLGIQISQEGPKPFLVVLCIVYLGAIILIAYDLYLRLRKRTKI